MTALIWEGAARSVEVAALIERVAAMTYLGRRPCGPDALALLGAVSQRILADSFARNVPQYVALAYWLRPAALTRLVAVLTSGDKGDATLLPRGVALHLPPTNVDTIFVYSWAMSVLAGNANVVRLARSLSGDAAWLVGAVSSIVAEHGEGDRQIFCHYDYGGPAEASLSAHCDLRMIWGGDAKVLTVSKTPIRPDGLSIGFPDRRSLAVIDAASYENASIAVRKRLAADFFNDTFWFDQMGCGSPRLVAWINGSRAASNLFYSDVQEVINQKNYRIDVGVAIGKRALANDLLAEGITSHYMAGSNELHVSHVEQPDKALSRVHGGGYLSEWFIDTAAQIGSVASRSLQTVTYFGLDRVALDQLSAAIIGLGGYRIVPIGQALQFDTIWDGVDLFNHMTRRLIVR